MDLLLALTSLLTAFSNQTSTIHTNIDLNEWYGSTPQTGPPDTSIKPAAIRFDQQMIEDLKTRLREYTSFKTSTEESANTFNSEAVNSWLTYWAERYPFKQRVMFFNQFPQFRTNIQGMDLQFLWVKPRVHTQKELVPILMLHGWPGSFREFYEAIPLITADDEGRNFAVEVIVPCLPGFGFSDAPTHPEFGGVQVAIVLRNLMRRLGYHRYYVQAQDWGRFIGSFMATLFPQEVLGFHTNWGLNISPEALKHQLLNSLKPSMKVEPELVEIIFPLVEKLAVLVEENGFLRTAVRRLDSIASILQNSPAALMTFILEKFTSGLVSGVQQPETTSTFTQEQLMDSLMMYWSSKSITNALRLYVDTFSTYNFAVEIEGVPTSVPTWVTHAKSNQLLQARILRHKFQNLLHETILDFECRFLAMQRPGLFAENVLTALSSFREWHTNNSATLYPEPKRAPSWWS